MSKASEWAERLIDARETFDVVNGERPEFELDGGRLKVFVMELGAAKLVASSGDNKIAVELRPGTEELLEFALAILETFSEGGVDIYERLKKLRIKLGEREA